MARAGQLAERAYIVDLAWLRSTPWRERVASTFDPPQWREELPRISAVTVRHRPDSAIAGLLFFGWLCKCLDWKPGAMLAQNGTMHGTAECRRGDVKMHLEPDRDDERAGPGRHHDRDRVRPLDLAGPRRRRPHRAAARDRKGREWKWTVMGASRGEAGILGEGIRQALLRDKSYGPGAQGRADDAVLSDREVVIVDDVAGAAAERMAAAVRAGGHIALSGGSTPRKAHEKLAAMGLDWSGVELWFGDDRAVPPDHEHSNYRMASESLGDVWPPYPPHPGRAGLRGRGRRLRGRAARRRSQGVPSLDLILLGLGPDAHTASLFPGDDALGERERLAVGVETPGHGAARVPRDPYPARS